MLPELVTPPLVLRPAIAADTDALWQLLVLPEIRRYLCDDRVLPREFVVELLFRAEASARQGLGMWVIEHDRAMIGLAALQTVPQVLFDLIPALTGAIEPTIALAPAWWGKGYASAALQAVLLHGFATLGLERIAAVADVPNVASDRMLTRAGFVPTGEHPGVHYRVRSYLLQRSDSA